MLFWPLCALGRAFLLCTHPVGAVSVPAEVHLHHTTHLLAVGAGALPVSATPLPSTGILAMLLRRIPPSLRPSPPMPPLPPGEAREKRSALALSVSSLRDTRIPTHSSLSSRGAFIFPLFPPLGPPETRWLPSAGSQWGWLPAAAFGHRQRAWAAPNPSQGELLPLQTREPAGAAELAKRPPPPRQPPRTPSTARKPRLPRDKLQRRQGKAAAAPGGVNGAPGAEQGRVRCCRVLRKVLSPGRVLQRGAGLEGSSVTAALR